MQIRKRTLISMIKQGYEKFTDDQKRILRNVSLDSFQNSLDIVVPIENNGIRLVDSNDILYVHEPKIGLVFIYTNKSEKIEYTSRAFDLLEYLVRVNESFRYLNNRMVANLNEMSHYNSYRRKVYFNNGFEVDVTGAAMKQIQKEMGKEKDSYLVTNNVIYEY